MEILNMANQRFRNKMTAVIAQLIAHDIQFTMSFRPADGWSEIHAFGEDAANMFHLFPSAKLGFDKEAPGKDYQDYCILTLVDHPVSPLAVTVETESACPFCSKPLGGERLFHQACADYEQGSADYLAEIGSSVLAGAPMAGGRI